MSRKKKNAYSLVNFLIDVVLTSLTGGFWLIWVFVREQQISSGTRTR